MQVVEHDAVDMVDFMLNNNGVIALELDTMLLDRPYQSNSR